MSDKMQSDATKSSKCGSQLAPAQQGQEFESEQNIIVAKRKNPTQKHLAEMKDQLMQSFKELMNTEIAEIKNQNSMILESNTQILQLLEMNTTNYNEIKNKIQDMELKYEAAVERISELETLINVMHKQSMRNMVEIRNVPRNSKENLNELVRNLYNTLDMEPTEVAANIYRRGKNNSPIVIEFKETKQKERLLKAVKKFNSDHQERQINTEYLGFSGPVSRVYISDSLTPISKKILAAARELVRSGKYKYCWTSRGNILIRKEEGLPTIVLNSLTQVKDLYRE